MAATQAGTEAKEQNQASLPPTTSTTAKITSSAASAFSFWIYLILAVSLLAFLLPFFLPHHRHRNNFLSLPDDLRLHFSRGRLLKLHFSHSPIQIFAIDSGPRDAADTVLLLPGLATSSFSFRHVISSLSAHGLRAVSLDFPGSGFSESPLQSNNPIWNAIQEIRNKGLFYAFDRLIETGHISNQQQLKDPFSASAAAFAASPSSPYGPAEMASIIGQVVDLLDLEPLHLVLHDSALVPGSSFVASNPLVVRSVTLVDSVAGLPAFPSLLLGVPVVGHLIVGLPVVFKGLLRLCL